MVIKKSQSPSCIEQLNRQKKQIINTIIRSPKQKRSVKKSPAKKSSKKKSSKKKSPTKKSSKKKSPAKKSSKKKSPTKNPNIQQVFEKVVKLRGNVETLSQNIIHINKLKNSLLNNNDILTKSLQTKNSLLNNNDILIKKLKQQNSKLLLIKKNAITLAKKVVQNGTKKDHLFNTNNHNKCRQMNNNSDYISYSNIDNHDNDSSSDNSDDSISDNSDDSSYNSGSPSQDSLSITVASPEKKCTSFFNLFSSDSSNSTTNNKNDKQKITMINHDLIKSQKITNKNKELESELEKCKEKINTTHQDIKNLTSDSKILLVNKNETDNYQQLQNKIKELESKLKNLEQLKKEKTECSEKLKVCQQQQKLQQSISKLENPELSVILKNTDNTEKPELLKLQQSINKNTENPELLKLQQSITENPELSVIFKNTENTEKPKISKSQQSISKLDNSGFSVFKNTDNPELLVIESKHDSETRPPPPTRPPPLPSTPPLPNQSLKRISGECFNEKKYKCDEKNNYTINDNSKTDNSEYENCKQNLTCSVKGRFISNTPNILDTKLKANTSKNLDTKANTSKNLDTKANTSKNLDTKAKHIEEPRHKGKTKFP